MENYKKIVDDYFNQKFEEFNLSSEIKSIDDLVEISENVVNMGINIKDNFAKELNISDELNIQKLNNDIFDKLNE